MEKTFKRLTLANVQLDIALFLFIEHQSYASAITLAGAAEEIFGKELSLLGVSHVLNWWYTNMALSHKLLHGKELEKKKFIDNKNLSRNALKHHQGGDTEITLDMKMEACWMLVRALENAQRLGLKSSRYHDFDNWFHENIVGV